MHQLLFSIIELGRMINALVQSTSSCFQRSRKHLLLEGCCCSQEEQHKGAACFTSTAMKYKGQIAPVFATILQYYNDIASASTQASL
jgi:hypothetical protein